ncbi:MAG: chromate transporter [Treponema sp.]|nr:chromate transporter [Treponema sp.]
MEKKDYKISDLVELFFVFFKIGAVTFGGGYAMLPMLERELAEKRNWTTKETMLDYYAIGQSTPGIIAVNVATFIGFNKAGLLGAIIATAGIVTPSIIIISLIASCISNFSQIQWVKKALAGINVAVAALLTKSVWDFSKKAVKNIWGLLLLLGAFIAMYFFGVESILVILVSATLGMCFSFLSAKKKGQEKKEGES